jgi:hypothetical protein
MSCWCWCWCWWGELWGDDGVDYVDGGWGWDGGGWLLLRRTCWRQSRSRRILLFGSSLSLEEGVAGLRNGGSITDSFRWSLMIRS